MPKINQEEYEILKSLDGKWKWIARDEDGMYGGDLFAYSEKQSKNNFTSNWGSDDYEEWLSIANKLFQFIQWEDKEPHNIAELIEEYEKDYKGSWEHAIEFSGEVFGESEETEVKKDLNWFKEQLDGIEMNTPRLGSHDSIWMLDRVNELLNQLDEPETLSQEWIDENKKYEGVYDIGYYIPVNKLYGKVVPKQEEVDQAYKDGYEKGKQYTFYKGYLEGLSDKENEPETVADVISDFWKSFERLKEVMSMEVEELEE